MHIQLKPDISVTKDSNQLVFKTAEFDFKWDGISPHTLAWIDKLIKGIDQEELITFAFEQEGESGLYHLYEALRNLSNRSLLSFSIPSFLTLIPLSSAFQFQEEAISGDGKFQLSRFCYCRPLEEKIVLETPLAAAQIVLHGQEMIRLFYALTQPCTIAELQELVPHLPQPALRKCIHLLHQAKVLVSIERVEEDLHLHQWEFHDLLFHSRSRVGRHSNPFGGTYPFKDKSSPLPAIKARPTSHSIPLFRPNLEQLKETDPSFASVLESRHSQREHDATPLTAEQLGEFLYRSARIKERLAVAGMELSKRPYPGGGAIYELEIYPLIHSCQGIESGLYHYNPEEHDLSRYATEQKHIDKLLQNAMRSTGMIEKPQVLFVLSARFPRVSWKYRSMAYAVILKNTGVLIQTFYLTATAMRLAPCGVGGGNSDLFAQAIGSNYYDETSVGEFILGSHPS